MKKAIAALFALLVVSAGASRAHATAQLTNPFVVKHIEISADTAQSSWFSLDTTLGHQTCGMQGGRVVFKFNSTNAGLLSILNESLLSKTPITVMTDDVAANGKTDGFCRALWVTITRP